MQKRILDWADDALVVTQSYGDVRVRLEAPSACDFVDLSPKRSRKLRKALKKAEKHAKRARA